MIHPKHSLLRDKWLAALGRTARGEISFVAPSSETWTFRGQDAGPTARFRIHEWGVLERLVARGDIGLGEDYIAGAWETDDLEALITFFLLNLDELEAFAHGSFLQKLAFKLHNTLVRRNSESGSRRNIEAHYDVGNDFYELWLDETMTYSSALFGGVERNLAAAQRRKNQRILSKIETSGASILEIGCGWGGFAEMATAERHSVTGLTISPAQHKYATARLNGAADIRLQDYRKASGVFDAVVSIEMIEAVGERYWPVYFQTIAERLKRGGRAVIQAIVIRDEFFAAYRTRSDFVRHYVFPGGILPSLARLQTGAEGAGLKLLDRFAFGHDYVRTLREWRSRMLSRKADVLALGHDERFVRNWQYYLAICAASFASKRSDVVQLAFVRT